MSPSADLPPLPNTAPAEDRLAPTGEHVHFVFKLGEALHRYGAPAHRLEALLEKVVARLGVDARFYSTPTAIFAAVGRPDELSSSFVRVPPGDMDLGRLVELDALSMALVDGEVSFTDAAAQLDAILEHPPVYSNAFTLVAYAVASAAGARLFGGGFNESMVALVAGFCVGLVAVLAPRVEALNRIQEAASALIASLLIALAGAFVKPLSIEVTTLAALLSLFPGLSLTVALTELATRNLMSGTARLAGAVTVLLQLTFGVALGGRIGVLFFDGVSSPPPEPALWTMAPAFILATVALVVLMRGRVEELWMMGLTALAGYIGTRLGASVLGPELGAFIGALVAATTSNALARVFDRPAVVALVPALLLLVPGSVGFRSVTSFFENDVIAGVSFAFSMLIVGVSLVAGLLLANVLMRPGRAL